MEASLYIHLNNDVKALTLFVAKMWAVKTMPIECDVIEKYQPVFAALEFEDMPDQLAKKDGQAVGYFDVISASSATDYLTCYEQISEFFPSLELTAWIVSDEGGREYFTLKAGKIVRFSPNKTTRNELTQKVHDLLF